MKLNRFTLALVAALIASVSPAADNDGTISLFNGKDLAGWKSNDEIPGVFTVENGELKVAGRTCFTSALMARRASRTSS